MKNLQIILAFIFFTSFTLISASVFGMMGSLEDENYSYNYRTADLAAEDDLLLVLGFEVLEGSTTVCPGETTSLLLMAVEGVEPYEWTWTFSPLTPSSPDPIVIEPEPDQIQFIDLHPGTLEVTVTDGDGEEFSQTFEIVELSNPFDVVVSPADCNGNGGEVELNFDSTQVEIIEGLILDDDIIIATWPDFIDLPNGNFSLDLTYNDNGQTCQVVEPLHVPIEIVGLSLISVKPICVTGPLDIDFSAEGGNSPYDLEVTLEGTDTTVNETISGLEEDTSTVSIDLPPGFFDPGSDPFYGEVKLIDSDGCESEVDTFEFEVIDSISVEVTGVAPSDTNQNDGSLEVNLGDEEGPVDVIVEKLDTTSGDWISIDTLVGVVPDSSGNFVIDDLEPGDYRLIVSRADEVCPPTTSGSTEVPPFECEMEITFGSSVVPIACAGDSTHITAIVLVGVPPYTYSFSNGDVQGPTNNSNAITLVPAGTHSVTITDSQPCTRVDEITITEPDEIAIDLTCPDTTACIGDTISISASASGGSGGLSYMWSNGEAGEQIEATEPGEYCVTVTDDNGCEATACCEIEECPEIEAEAEGFAPTDSTQSDGQIKVTVNQGANDTFDVVVVKIDTMSGDTISIETIEGVVADSMGCIVIGDLTPGTYEIEVSDPSGEKVPWVSGPIEIPPYQPEPECDIEVIIDCPSGLLCPEADSVATLTANVTGGSGNFSISWSTGESSSSIDVGESGEFCVTVTDNTLPDCEAEACCEFVFEVCPTIEIDISCSKVCPGEEDGFATATASGGCGDLTYEWSNGVVSGGPNSIIDLAPGMYCVTVTDEEGCTAVACCTVEECPPIVLNFIECDTICPNASDGTAIVSASGGCGSLSYVWDNGDTGSTATGLGGGEHCVTITDEEGCELVACCTIEEEDDVDPVAICQDITVNLDVNGNATISGGDVDGGSTDNCEIVSLDVDPSNFDCDDIGVQTVTLTVTDIGGNQDECTASVTIADNLPPVVNCPNPITESTDLGECDAFVNFVATADDNCEVASITYNPDIFIYDLGTTVVTVTATDGSGNTATCQVSVTINDEEDPTISCPNDIAVPTDPNECDAFVNFVATADDNCEVASITYNPDIFIYGLGTTVVTVTATDGSGNTATCQVSVTVNDNEDPVINCPQGQIVFTDPGFCNAFVILPNATATDNCPPANITNNFNAGGANATGIYPLGPSNVIFTATDASGNIDVCQITITVIDNEDPNAVCQAGLVNFNLDANGNVNILPADINNGSTDNCNIAMMTVTPDMFDCDDLFINAGAQMVTLTVTDGSGNIDQCQSSIAINDISSPNAECRNRTFSVDENGEFLLSAAMIDDGSDDNCDFDLQVFPDSFSCVNIGTNSVTLTATDGSNNTDNCQAVLNLVDSIPPDIQCPEDTVIILPQGQNQVFVNLPLATADDNCTPVTITNDYNQGGADASDTYFLGSTVVIYTAVDTFGNDQSCSSEILVYEPGSAFFINGTIYSENQDTIQGVIVDMSGDQNESDTTASDGFYEHLVFPVDSVTIKPRRNEGCTEGVTTLSLILIQQHILQIQLLSSPYKYIAADANFSGTITTTDLVLLQSLIIGVFNELPHGDCWRFVKEDYVFVDPTDPLSEDFPESQTYVSLNQDSLNEDWIAIKLGNVSNAPLSGSRKEKGEFRVNLVENQHSDGSVEFIVQSGETKSLSGYQMEWKYDPQVNEFWEIDISGSMLNGLNTDNFFVDEDAGLIRANWYNAFGQQLSDGDELFKLRFKSVGEDGSTANILFLMDKGSRWDSEAYSVDATELFKIKVVSPAASDLKEYVLHQNQPNPHKGETVIPFELPNEMQATLEILNSDGKLLRVIEVDGNRGINSITLKTDDMPQGVLYYRLVTDEWSGTKRMIYIH